MYVIALAASQVYTKPKLNLPSDYSCGWYFMQFFYAGHKQGGNCDHANFGVTHLQQSDCWLSVMCMYRQDLVLLFPSLDHVLLT